MAANRIYLQVVFNSEGAEANIDKLNQNIKNIGTNSEQATKQAAAGMKNVSVSVESVTDEISRLGRVIAAAGIGREIEHIIHLGEELNRVRGALLRGTGGNELLKQLDSLAESGLATEEQLVRTANQMINAGVAADQVAPRIKALIDTLAAKGLDPHNLETAMRLLNEITVQGQVSPKKAVSLFRESGLDVFAELSQGIANSRKEFRDEMKKIPADEFIKELLARAGKEYEGTADKIANVTKEQIKLNNAWGEFARELATSFGPEIADLVKELTALLRLLTGIVHILGELPSPLKTVLVNVIAITAAIKTIGSLLSVLRGVQGLSAAAGIGAAGTGPGSGGGGRLLGLGLGGAAEAANVKAAEAAQAAKMKAAEEAAAAAKTAAEEAAAAKTAAKAQAKADAQAAREAKQATRAAAGQAAKEAADAAAAARAAGATAAAGVGAAATTAAAEVSAATVAAGKTIATAETTAATEAAAQVEAGAAVAGATIATSEVAAATTISAERVAAAKLAGEATVIGAAEAGATIAKAEVTAGAEIATGITEGAAAAATAITAAGAAAGAAGAAAGAASGAAKAGIFARIWTWIRGIFGGGGLTTLNIGRGAAVAGEAAGAAEIVGAGAAVAGRTFLGMTPTGWITLIALTVGQIILEHFLPKLLGGGEKTKVGLPTGASGGLHTVEDPEKVKHEIETSLNFLSEAQARNLKVGKEGIAALTFSYEEYFRKVAKNEEALANYRKALAIDVDTEIKKRTEETRRETLRWVEEMGRVSRQQDVLVAELTYGTDTLAGRRKVDETRAQAFEADLEETTKYKKEEIRRAADLDAQAAHDAILISRITAKSTARERLEAEKAAVEASMKILLDADQRISMLEQHKNAEEIRHALETEVAKREIAIEEKKRSIDTQLQLDQALAQKETALRVAYLQTVRPRSYQEQIDLINQTADAQVEGARKSTEAQKQATEDYITWYQGKYKDATDAVNEMRNNQEKERTRLDAQFTQQEGEIRLAAWKQTNELIIEQQRSMYEQMLSGVDQFWGALMDRSKSVWASIGDLIKNSLTNALKSFITSRFAAALTEMFGGGKVEFTGTWLDKLLGRRPYYQGTGEPRPNVERATAEIQLKVASLQYTAGKELLAAAAGLQQAARSLVVASGGGGAGEAARSVSDAEYARIVSSAGGVGPEGIPESYGLPGGVSGDWAGETGTPVAFPGGGTAATFPGGAAAATLPGMMPGMAGSTGLGGGGIRLPGIGSITGGKQGLANLAYGLGAMVGTSLFLSSLQRRGVRAGLQGIGGAALAGYSLAKQAGLSGQAGALAGAGVGIYAAGMKRGGVTGLLMDVGGAALTGFAIGAMFGGPIGALVGGAIGAGVGLVSGVARLIFGGSKTEEVRTMVRRAYGVDISDSKILQQIVDTADQKFGGDLRLAVYSPDVMELVRLYAMTTGQSQMGLPRPMYAASFAQSGAGGLQLQPVYSGGQLVNSPYSGTTTTQWQNATAPLYMQLNPSQATALFSGQVVQVMGNNPGAVGAANTVAARSGQGRQGQTAALIEPATVLQ